jgi:sulfate transport system ATP-binding protein
LECTPLGQGEVEQASFSGAYERVHVRLPALPGMRPIAPPVPFGESSLRIESLRALDHSRRLPLAPGAPVWVGVRRIHALAQPGLNYLIVTDGSPAAQAAVTLGGQLARLANARVTLLGYGHPPESLDRHLQTARETLGSVGSGPTSLEARSTPDPLPTALALETERQAFDLVILGFQPQGGLALAERVLETGRHHLLLVPKAQSVPTRALLSVTGSEPGKEDMLGAGPLLSFLGAETTLFSVLPAANALLQQRVEAFLASGARTLAALGVPTDTAFKVGPIADSILETLKVGAYDLLVLGAPLADRAGRVAMTGVISQILHGATEVPTLIVRSRYASAQAPQLTFDGRIMIVEEIVT